MPQIDAGKVEQNEKKCITHTSMLCEKTNVGDSVHYKLYKKIPAIDKLVFLSYIWHRIFKLK
jgi:hypothetical protein